MERKECWFRTGLDTFLMIYYWSRANLPFPGHLCNSGSLARIGLSPNDQEQEHDEGYSLLKNQNLIGCPIKTLHDSGSSYV